MLKEISKELAEGETTTIVGHLVNKEREMGRSLIIDLNAPLDNRFRQVDHRTIQSIVLRNVKYNLAKKSTLNTLIPFDGDTQKPKWTLSKLQKGDWFSELQYYRLGTQNDCSYYCTILRE